MTSLSQMLHHVEAEGEGKVEEVKEIPTVTEMVASQAAWAEHEDASLFKQATMASIRDTLNERGSRYGEFPEHARITQNIKNAMADSPNWHHLRPDMKEALEMVAHKIGRILNGDPSYKDSWHDIEGYVHLVSETLED